jgi:hypothetical protein
MGHSYARQHFNHRADLCCRAAMAAGHPDAEQALAALPRTREGLIEPGNDPTTGAHRSGHPADAAHSPIRTHGTPLAEDPRATSHTSISCSPGHPTQPVRSLERPYLRSYGAGSSAEEEGGLAEGAAGEPRVRCFAINCSMGDRTAWRRVVVSTGNDRFGWL